MLGEIFSTAWIITQEQSKGWKKKIRNMRNNICRCGYATVHDVHDMSLEDRQESFFLSETVKYLFLLFDFDNPINHHSSNYLFTTEGHVLPISNR